MSFFQKILLSVKATIVLFTLVLTVCMQPATAYAHTHKRVPSFTYPYPISQERIEAEQLLNQGLTKAYKQDFQGAIAILVEATQTDPTDEAVYRYLGDVYRQAGDSQGAIAAYSDALQYNPYFARLYNSRGEVYLGLKNYDKAIADFSKAIEVYPEDPIGYYNRGIAYYDLKNYPQTIYDLGEAIRIDHTYAEAYVGRGKVRQALNNSQGSIEDYLTATTLLQRKSEQLLEQGNPEKYQQVQQQLQALFPKGEVMKTDIS
jgi:tetratricopeptide (TPR) repeat protein